MLRSTTATLKYSGSMNFVKFRPANPPPMTTTFFFVFTDSLSDISLHCKSLDVKKEAWPVYVSTFLSVIGSFLTIEQTASPAGLHPIGCDCGKMCLSVIFAAAGSRGRRRSVPPRANLSGGTDSKENSQIVESKQNSQ